VNRLRTEHPRNRGSVLGKRKRLSSLPYCLERIWSHLTSYLMRKRVCISGLSLSRREADPAPSFRAEIKNELNYTPTPPIRCNDVNRDNFNFLKKTKAFSIYNSEDDTIVDSYLKDQLVHNYFKTSQKH